MLCQSGGTLAPQQLLTAAACEERERSEQCLRTTLLQESVPIECSSREDAEQDLLKPLSEEGDDAVEHRICFFHSVAMLGAELPKLEEEGLEGTAAILVVLLCRPHSKGLPALLD